MVDNFQTGTLTAPFYNVLFYMVIPQSFEENSLLTDLSFFDSSSCGWIQPAEARRQVLIHGEWYWLYNLNAYGAMNVMCGY